MTTRDDDVNAGADTVPNNEAHEEPPAAPTRQNRAPRRCGLCKEIGHDRRNCPHRNAEPGQNGSIESPGTRPRSTPVPPATPERPKFKAHSTMYVVFDLETTGFSKERNHIIQVGVELLQFDGILIEDGKFASFVRPPVPIPRNITELTGISNDDVGDAPDFSVAGKNMILFIQDRVTIWEGVNEGKTVHCIAFVAHNGARFDVPFLFSAMNRFEVREFDSFIQQYTCFQVDTMLLAKHAIQGPRRGKLPIPTNYKLGSLYEYVSGKDLGASAHRADADVAATTVIFRHKPFWTCRKEVIKELGPDGRSKNSRGQTSPTSQPATGRQDDSDTDQSQQDDSDSDEEENEEDYSVQLNLPAGASWTLNTAFAGLETKEKFEDVFRRRSTRCGAPQLTGLQCSVNSVNSPSKAWRQLFTNSILDKIVGYTNDYGDRNNKKWEAIDRADLIDFISVLFIASIQKRKDKPDNWFSTSPYLESPIIKKIMTGRKFHMLLRYLHVASIDDQPRPTDVNYDPGYKVKELLDYLEGRYAKLFVPGRTLSRDESLIRSFGRMKFKVRIVTKAARYGIKIYVITDAVTAFVLKVIIYTGKHTYDEPASENLKKTVQIVRALCLPFEGSHRTVYVDRFYTSIDLLRELDKMKLYCTGTCMKNRIPSEVTIAKQSAEFKRMNRGDFKRHVFSYRDENEKLHKFGLVCWKDRDIVYGLTNECDTISTGVCYRRSQGGVIALERPRMIGDYNTYMGGVDLADMRRLHCNSTIMGQNRWWLKLFFYLLDVATANSLVLFKEATEKKNESMSIVEYKSRLVDCFVGSRVTEIPRLPFHGHTAVRSNSRHNCAYCALYSSETHRTRFKCSEPTCAIPLCSVGTGGDRADCFSLCHQNEAVRTAVLSRYQDMKKKTNRMCHELYGDTE